MCGLSEKFLKEAKPIDVDLLKLNKAVDGLRMYGNLPLNVRSNLLSVHTLLMEIRAAMSRVAVEMENLVD